MTPWQWYLIVALMAMLGFELFFVRLKNTVNYDSLAVALDQCTDGIAWICNGMRNFSLGIDVLLSCHLVHVAELDRMLERLPVPVTSPHPSRIPSLRRRVAALASALERISVRTTTT